MEGASRLTAFLRSGRVLPGHTVSFETYGTLVLLLARVTAAPATGPQAARGIEGIIESRHGYARPSGQTPLRRRRLRVCNGRASRPTVQSLCLIFNDLAANPGARAQYLIKRPHKFSAEFRRAAQTRRMAKLLT